MITQQLITDNIGKYIRFEGMGIIDGLKQRKTKYSFYKIIGLDNEGLLLRGYRLKRYSVLPFHNWNQNYQIIDKKEYQTLLPF